MGAGAERRGPGLVRGLTMAVLLGATGFALGLGVGASWEDPGLLLRALAGNGQTLELTESAPEPQVAAPPPLGARSVEEAGTGAPAVSAPPSRREAVAPPPAPAPGAPAPAAAPDAGFSVQVGAFRDRGAARSLEHRLGERGFEAFVTGGEGQGAQPWRVRVGPVASRSDAEALAGRLKREQGLPTWVVSHDD